MKTCSAVTDGKVTCPQWADYGSLCYYHDKMSRGLIAPHDPRISVKNKRGGTMIYTPGQKRAK